jgi:hypothetical protein
MLRYTVCSWGVKCLFVVSCNYSGMVFAEASKTVSEPPQHKSTCTMCDGASRMLCINMKQRGLSKLYYLFAELPVISRTNLSPQSMHTFMRNG